MELVMITATVGYLIFLSVLMIGWKRIKVYPMPGESNRLPKVTVVLVVRNEVENISLILDDLMEQSLSSEDMEIIVMDDHSEDGTWEVLYEKEMMCPHLRIVQMGNIAGDLSSPKKAGITHAVNIAIGEVILISDGDCRTGKDWARHMTFPFMHAHINFVSGPVKLQETGHLWAAWQKLEFASLIGTGGALIGLDHPVLCNGANMAFRKSTFTNVGGYGGDLDLASGDDVFLMQKIHRRYGGIAFLKDPAAVVSTPPQPNWRSFTSQRIRWAGKWTRFHTWYAIMLPIGIFTFYFLLLISCALTIMGRFNPWLILLIASLKIIFDYLFLERIYAFYKEKLNIGLLVISSLSYSIYAVAFGIVSNFTGYQWKERNYKKHWNE